MYIEWIALPEGRHSRLFWSLYTEHGRLQESNQGADNLLSNFAK